MDELEEGKNHAESRTEDSPSVDSPATEPSSLEEHSEVDISEKCSSVDGAPETDPDPKISIDPSDAEHVPAMSNETAGDGRRSELDPQDTSETTDNVELDESPTANTSEQSSNENTTEETGITGSEDSQDAVTEKHDSHELLQPIASTDQPDDKRDQLLTLMIREQRPPLKQLSEELEAYGRSQDPNRLFDEFVFFSTQMVQKNDQASIDERAELNKNAQPFLEFKEEIKKLFEQIPDAIKHVQAAIEKRSDELITSLGEDVQDNLRTYRQGLEIIERMLQRTFDRAPNLQVEDTQLEEMNSDYKLMNEKVSTEKEFATCLTNLSRNYHETRDTNYHLINDARVECEKQTSKAKNSLKQILAAIDGIDSGLQNEAETRGRVDKLMESDEEAKTVVQEWYNAYEDLSQKLYELIANTKLTPIAVEEGTPFDPETMEPQGVVERANLKNDDVAVILRKGFTFCDELIRPTLVEVVKNP